MTGDPPAHPDEARLVIELQKLVHDGLRGIATAVDYSAFENIPRLVERRRRSDLGPAALDELSELIVDAVASSICRLPTPYREASTALLGVDELKRIRGTGKTAREERAAKPLGRTGRWLRGPSNRPPYNGQPPSVYLYQLIARDLLQPSITAEVTESQAVRSARFSPLGIFGNADIAGSRHSYAAEVILEFARVLSGFSCVLVHGPRAAGIEVANACHNIFMAEGVRSALMFGDRRRLIEPCEVVFLIGGNTMSQAEAELALRLKKRFAPIPGTGGAADRYTARLLCDPSLARDPWIRPLLECHTAPEVGDWLEHYLGSPDAAADHRSRPPARSARS